MHTAVMNDDGFSTQFSTSTKITSATMGDFDGDGFDDIVYVVTTGEDTYKVFLVWGTNVEADLAKLKTFLSTASTFDTAIGITFEGFPATSVNFGIKRPDIGRYSQDLFLGVCFSFVHIIALHLLSFVIEHLHCIF